MSKNNTISFPINEQIRGTEFRVIGVDGENLGIRTREEALAEAAKHNLDLVLIAMKADPQVVRVIDYSKFKYEQQKMEAQRRKGQKSSLKEIRFKPNIDENDLNIRIRKTREFLEDGDKVRVSIPFFGRMKANQSVGREKMQKMIDDVADVGEVEREVRMEGNFMTMMLKGK